MSIQSFVNQYLSETRGFEPERLQCFYQIVHKKSDHDDDVIFLRFPIYALTNALEGVKDGYQDFWINSKGNQYFFKKGWNYRGFSWSPVSLVALAAASEIWITEGIFNSIALFLSGVASISQLGISNYPGQLLFELESYCQTNGLARPTLVFAVDNNGDGVAVTGAIKNMLRATEYGWRCVMALPPVSLDWNELYKVDKLSLDDLNLYRQRGDELVALLANKGDVA